MSLYKKFKYRAEEKSLRAGYGELSDFDDPIGLITDWTPLLRGGTNIKSHKLVWEGQDKLRFKASWGHIMIAGFVFLLGLSLPLLFFLGNNSGSFVEASVAIIAGLLFAAIGAYLYYNGTQPIVFDKKQGFFYKGRKNTDKNSEKAKVKYMVRLEDIYALQLLSEYISSEGKETYSYEINLVLKDATRVNVIDHGKLSTIRQDASTLADFLDVPVWDVIKNITAR
ncbi:MAG: hypothetical protein AAFY45_04390 [Bacteroidota bacterium]